MDRCMVGLRRKTPIFGKIFEMKNIWNRYLFLILVVISISVLVYAVGFFYQKFINSPLDFAALVFIVAIYGGAVYHHLQRSED
jgi:biotin transporter BioY